MTGLRHVVHRLQPGLVALAVLVVTIVLAACNNGNGSTGY